MLTIQILGIGCKKSRALKANLLEALAAVPIDNVSLEEITAVSDIVRYQIQATPALMFDGRLVSEGYVPEVQLLERLLQSYQYNPQHVKKVLIPTDFSDTAAHAFQFAQQLFQGQAVLLQLLHVYHPMVSASFSTDLSETQLMAWQHQRVQQFAAGHALRTPDAQQQRIKSTVSKGFASETIVNASADADLIIMGTTGDGDWLEHLFGSVSSHVAKFARCPVLLVPSHSAFKNFKKLLFASDYSADDAAMLQQLLNWKDIVPAEVHFVHVDVHAGKKYQLKKTATSAITNQARPDLELIATEIEAQDVLYALNAYANAQEIDLLVMSTSSRSFLENLFHRSLTQRMILQAQLPVLILHFGY